jgi:hypothetical protein
LEGARVHAENMGFRRLGQLPAGSLICHSWCWLIPDLVQGVERDLPAYKRRSNIFSPHSRHSSNRIYGESKSSEWDFRVLAYGCRESENVQAAVDSPRCYVGRCRGRRGVCPLSCRKGGSAIYFSRYCGDQCVTRSKDLA